MRIPLTLVLIILSFAKAQAQSVVGLIRDDQGKPLANSSVALKNTKDSSVVKLSASTKTGQYSFINIAEGSYFISVTHIGHNPKNSAAFNVQSQTTVPDLVLTRSSNDLKEVTVLSKKPLVEVKADKIVLNVEGSINAIGQDALDLLRKSPGVLVDNDNKISVNGKNGVQIFIDGRPTPLTGTDLSEYLKTIQSSSIESIEIINNPSARYEAAGNAGIINIKLKKDKSVGTNGTVNAGYSNGTYSKYNAGISLNHRNKHVNIFGNYSYSRPHSWFSSHLERRQLDTLFDNNTLAKFYSNNHNFKLGADFFINRFSTVGIMASGGFTDNTTNLGTNSQIIYSPTNQLDRVLIAENNSTGKRDNENANINYRFADTSGHELNIDADFGHYRIRSNQMQPNNYYDPNGNYLYDHTYNMLSPSNIDIYSLKSDYDQNFAKGKLSVGFKVSYVTSGNDFQQFNIFNGSNSKVKDTLHSNNFEYRENINAVYANYNRSIKKSWVLQAGLRVENTNVKGISTGYQDAGGSSLLPYDSNFDRHYVGFFPSGAVTYNKNPAKQWTLNYSRRIDRPAYQDLNPFEFKVDEYTFQKGNTQLRPQYTNSVGLTFMYKYKLTTTLNYSHVKDLFTQLVDTTETSKAFLTKKNLATQNIVSLNISYPLQLKWYSVFINANSFYSRYNASFGPGRTIDVDVFTANLYAQQTARLGKGWTAELSGYFTTPSIYQGTFKTKTLGSVDGGFSKTLFKGAATLKATVTDIFATSRFRASSNFAGQTLQVSGRSESRQLRIAFSYRFGSNQIKAARQRKTGSEDENKRVGSQSSGGGGQ